MFSSIPRFQLDTNMPVYARNGVASLVSRLDELCEQGEVTWRF